MASLRRSSAKLRTLGSDNADLRMAVAQLKELRSATKALASAQESAAHDLMKWAYKEENQAIKDVIGHFGDLCELHNDAQKDFAEKIKEFRNQFEMILDGQRSVSKARSAVDMAEAVEVKLRKEVKKLTKKAPVSDELREVEDKLAKAGRDRDFAEVEASCKAKENEVVKMMRVKEGLVKLSQAQIELAEKSAIIFKAALEVSDQIPDVTSVDVMIEDDILDLKYTGGRAASNAVASARDQLKRPMTSPTPTVTSTSVAAIPLSPPPYDEIEGQLPANPYYSSSCEASFNSSGFLTTPNSSGLYPELECTTSRRRSGCHDHSGLEKAVNNMQIKMS